MVQQKDIVAYGYKVLKDGDLSFPYEPWMREEDFPPPKSFPEKGLSEEKVVEMVKERTSRNIPPERYFFMPATFHDAHPFAKKIYAMPDVMCTFQSGLARRYNPTGYEVSAECVRMIASLLGANHSEAGGFLNLGGTESNIWMTRLARDLYRKERPEIVATMNVHYSWAMACEALGVKLRVAGLNTDLSVRMNEVERMINENTIMLVASTPEVTIGTMDPVDEFAELAEKHSVHLHSDAAYGGFLFPFLRELGYDVPPFDFSVPQVKSMTADPHKYLSPKPISSIIIRDREYLKAIPVEKTYQPVLSGSARLGAPAYAFWALVHHLGLEGYRAYIKHDMDLTKMLGEEVERIGDLENFRGNPIWKLVPWCIVTSREHDLKDVHRRLFAKGWYVGIGTLPDGKGTTYLRIAIDWSKTERLVHELLADLKSALSSN